MTAHPSNRHLFHAWLAALARQFVDADFDRLVAASEARVEEWTAPPTTPEVEQLCAEMTERFRK